MKIAVCAMADDVNSLVDVRFGRCPYFIIAEVENNEIKRWNIVKNTAANEFSGAGIRAAQLLLTEGINALICGNLGPNAYRILSSAGIELYSIAENMTVKQAIEKYLRNELQKQQGFMPRGRGFRWRHRRGWRGGW